MTTKRAQWLVGWPGGLLAAFLLVGPGLAPGYLLSLDLVTAPRIPVPRGMWGLGPELPRRIPVGAVIAWLSNLTDGAFATKLLIVVAIAAAFVGASRLASGAPVVARAAAGLLYAIGPFMATRVGAGHLTLVAAAAVLPWVLPTLLRPDEDLRKTFLAAAALGLTGFIGGTYGAVPLLVGLIAARGRRLPAVVGVFVAAQLPWLVSGFIVALANPDLGSSGNFRTAGGPFGVVGELVAGHGFWRAPSQVGGTADVAACVVGFALLVLAVVGTDRLPRPWGRRAAWMAAIGFALAAASGLPGLSGLLQSATELPGLVVLRENQRFLVLYLVWLAPAAALGAAKLAHPVARNRAIPVVVLFAATFVLAAPGVWGVEGRLTAEHYPEAWGRVRHIVSRQPGAVLGLPWNQYLSLSFAGDRRVLNPLPDYLGGNVVVSSDPQLGAERFEQADPRESTARAIANRVVSGRQVGSQLAGLHARWVVLLHEVDWADYRSLDHDPGLRIVLDTRTISLYEVRAWNGDLVDDRGRAVDEHGIVAPLARADPSPAATWDEPAADGWLRGTEVAGATSTGLVRFPAGSGLLWYWPALLVLASYAGTAAGAVFALRGLRRARRDRAGDPADTADAVDAEDAESEGNLTVR